jgi:hypothetical protein
MPIKRSHPPELLGVAEILDALGIDCIANGDEPIPYLAIPGNSGPRWLIPARSRASGQVLNAWRPYSISGQAKWLAVRITARAGILPFAGVVSSVEVSRAASLRWFERCAIQSRSGEMIILVGNPSPSRKLIAFLLDDAQGIAAVLKVGLTAEGGAKVIHEAEVLRKLEGHSWAPKVLSIHPDLGAAAQEYLPGALAVRRFQPEYLGLLCQLPRSGNVSNLVNLAQTLVTTLSPYREEWDKVAPDLLNRSLNCLDLDIDLPTLLVHGDFAPWNIRITPHSGLALVDWESANFAGLPGDDLLHFLFSNDRLFSGQRKGSPALRARPLGNQYLRQMNLDEKLWPRLAIAYLLHQLKADHDQCDPDFAFYALCQLAALVEATGPRACVRPTA